MSNRLKTFFTDLANVYREASGTTDKIVANTLPAKFDELLKNGVGGDSELIAYVTFMSEDGSTELFKMPVLKGDNCKDPVEHGDIEAPTKESTAQNNYSFSGWGNVNDVAIPTILNNITEDRVVYASFTASTRYYTINFFDDDGTTIIETLSLPYGETPTPKEPLKDGYVFTEWIPSLEIVTGDMNYQATFEVDDGSMKDSWTTISENIKNGTYKDLYSVGDFKKIVITDADGVSRTLPVEIIAFDHETIKQDGSYSNSTPSITFMTSQSIKLKGALDKNGWASSSFRSNLQSTTKSELPSELVNVLGLAKKSNSYVYLDSVTQSYCDDSLWLPSAEEVGFTGTNDINSVDKPYSERFSDNDSRKISQVSDTYATISTATRTMSNSSGYYAYIIKSSGARGTDSFSGVSNTFGVVCFCIV